MYPFSRDDRNGKFFAIAADTSMHLICLTCYLGEWLLKAYPGYFACFCFHASTEFLILSICPSIRSPSSIIETALLRLKGPLTASRRDNALSVRYRDVIFESVILCPTPNTIGVNNNSYLELLSLSTPIGLRVNPFVST